MAKRSRLRVLLVTVDDPLYVRRFCDVFFREYPVESVDLMGLTVDSAFHQSRFAAVRRILPLYGVANFLRLGGRMLKARLANGSIPALARREGIPLIPTDSVNDRGYIEVLRELRPDVIATIAGPEIFKQPILDLPSLGCINLHSGRLPEYRGMLPVFWQMLRGERTATVTVHCMAERVDAGPVLGTEECPIEARDSVHRVQMEAKRVGARLMIRVLRELAKGTASPQPLDIDSASYFSFPSREDRRSLERRGHRML